MPPANTNLKSTLPELIAFPLFNGFESEMVEKLCGGGLVRVNRHREILFQLDAPANQFAVVLSGAYKLSRFTPEGDEAIIYFTSPGDVIAALVMSQENPRYPVTVKAMGPSRVLLIDRSTYTQEWLKYPNLIMRVQGLLSTRMNRFQNQKLMLRAPLQAKIASLLLQMIAKENSTELEVPIPLTRKDIADSLGASVESVIRVMSDWEKAGTIITSEQHIKIIQPESLVKATDQN